MADASLAAGCEVGVVQVTVRSFTVPAPSQAGASPWAAFARREPVSGWLVGATGGRKWGWWGPVEEATARGAATLFDSIDDRGPGSPGEWGTRARRAVRHAHAGVLAVAAGALELACWDLAGVLHDAPVWALLGSGEGPASVPAYATCFGIPPGHPDAEAVAAAVARQWRVQKWRPASAVEVDALADAAGGDETLALDFGGDAPIDAVLQLGLDIEHRLAWMEEPFAPDELHRAADVTLPAPHAAGEHCYGPADAAVLRAARVSIWQPDAVFCGGFAHLVELVNLAQDAGARCLPHGGGLLPSLHAARLGFPVEAVEWHLLLEPRRQAHLAAPAVAAEGAVMVPERPGWAGPLSPVLLGGHGE